MIDLDSQIEQHHKAVADAEAEAQQILDRIRRVPGLEAFGKRGRSIGTYPNPWARGTVNLSAQGAILRHDPGLGSWLASKAGATLPSNEEALAREAQRQQSIERIKAETAAMAQRNQARRQQQHRDATYGRWDPLRMKVI